MQGDPRVLAALDAAYAPILAAFEQFHRQEHRFKRQQYRSLACRYDGLVHAARCWRREVLDRVEQLGGDLGSVIPAGAVAVQDGVSDAFRSTLDSLDAIFGALGAAIEAAQAAGDHPSMKVALRVQSHVDRKRTRVKGWAQQVIDIGPAFLLSAI
jgi:bacterioferritin (cytochrome b1)